MTLATERANRADFPVDSVDQLNPLDLPADPADLPADLPADPADPTDPADLPTDFP